MYSQKFRVDPREGIGLVVAHTETEVALRELLARTVHGSARRQGKGGANGGLERSGAGYGPQHRRPATVTGGAAPIGMDGGLQASAPRQGCTEEG